MSGGERVMGYEVSGRRYVLGRNDAGEVDHFVQRWTGPGRSWLRFLKKMTADGYHVTASKTLREATHGWTVERGGGEGHNARGCDVRRMGGAR